MLTFRPAPAPRLRPRQACPEGSSTVASTRLQRSTRHLCMPRMGCTVVQVLPHCMNTAGRKKSSRCLPVSTASSTMAVPASSSTSAGTTCSAWLSPAVTAPNCHQTPICLLSPNMLLRRLRLDDRKQMGILRILDAAHHAGGQWKSHRPAAMPRRAADPTALGGTPVHQRPMLILSQPDARRDA